VTPTPQPRPGDGTFLNLGGTGIDFAQGALHPDGPHTFEVTLTYQGTTLAEQITDLTTGATFTQTYEDVDLAAAVGGSTAYVGFGSGTDSRFSTNEILSWTYQSGGATVIDHADGFDTSSDLTANGDAGFDGGAAQLNMPNFDSEGTIFFNDPVPVGNFTTTFQFRMDPARSVGDGISFILQAEQGQQPAPDYGDTLLKLAPTPGTMTVADFFTPTDQQGLAVKDVDFGTAATLGLPAFPGTAHPHLVLEEAKNGVLYVVDADNMGGLGDPVQTITVNQSQGPTLDGLWGAMSFYNNTLYIHDAFDVLKAYRLRYDPATNSMLFDPDPISTGDVTVSKFGDSTSVSAFARRDGIVWDLQTDDPDNGPAVLRAYRAGDLGDVLFDSSQNAADQGGQGVKFTVPTVADGKVFVGTMTELDIYGLRLSGSEPHGGADQSLTWWLPSAWGAVPSAWWDGSASHSTRHAWWDETP
jgi:hypothetical protein